MAIENMEANNMKKDVTIIVNGREKIVEKDDVLFEEIVVLAFGEYNNSPDTVYTGTYSSGHSKNIKGTIVKGESVKVKQGMIFNVSRTDRS